MSIWSRTMNVFRGDRVGREIDEELHAHIEEAIEQEFISKDPVRKLALPKKLQPVD